MQNTEANNVEYIRGAEIVDIRDEEGVPANEGFPELPKDTSNNNKHPPPPPDAMDEGPKKPSGYDRVFTLEVDCARTNAIWKRLMEMSRDYTRCTNVLTALFAEDRKRTISKPSWRAFAIV